MQSHKNFFITFCLALVGNFYFAWFFSWLYSKLTYFAGFSGFPLLFWTLPTLEYFWKFSLPSLTSSKDKRVEGVYTMNYNFAYNIIVGCNNAFVFLFLSFLSFYGVNLRIQSECGKIRIIKAPNTDTFCAVDTMDTMHSNLD